MVLLSLKSSREGKKDSEQNGSKLTEFNVVLISSWMQLWFFTVQ
jgi:hypothetical protein